MNEILTRNTDSAGGVEFTLVYNLRGDLEDEGGTGGYKYVYDAFGRLVEVRRQNNSLLAAYRYNGLNQRITWHYDATGNGTTDGSDPVYHFCYDDKWRIVGTWRGTDTDPKELFIYHAAGVAGYSGSSYIDSVVLRDRDNTNKWSLAADGTLETRHYYAQNWRADVSAIFDNSGAVIEWQKYSAYGVPFLLTPGDHGKDGGISAADQTAFNADYAANSPRADLNRDGAWTTADQTLFTASYNAAAVGGRWKLSTSGLANRKGYAGYEHEGFGNDLAAPELAHVRHRVLHFGLGRWTRRDPLGYVDGRSLGQYCASRPIDVADASGLYANFYFWTHYYIGAGRPLDLGRLGLGAAYEAHPAVVRITAARDAAVQQLARQAAIQMAEGYRCDCFTGPQINQERLSGSFFDIIERWDFIASPPSLDPRELASWFWYTDWTFAIGGHKLAVEYDCDVYVKCGYCRDGSECTQATHIRWTYQCVNRYRMSDVFKDRNL